MTDVAALDLTRPLATLRADAITVPAGRVLPSLDRAGGYRAGRGPVRRRGLRHRRLGGADRRRVRQDQAPVRPPDRAVPGGQAPLRPDADRRRTGHRSGVGCRADPVGQRARVRRRRGRGGRGRRGGRRGKRLHPDAGRHRLHLGARRPPVLPPGAVAACAARPVGPVARPTFSSTSSPSGCSACRATPSRPPGPSPSGGRGIDASRASQSGSYRPCAAGAANLSWRACMGG